MEADMLIDEKNVTIIPLSYYIFKWPNILKIPLNEIISLEIRSIPRMTFLMITTKKTYPKAYMVSVNGTKSDYMRYLQEKIPKNCSIYETGWFFKQKRIK